jgi:predicted RNA-binding Zn-ribbon protein involved in translation (DUF1610 family)
MSITSTVGAVRALEERISVEEEKLQQLNSELKEVRRKIANAEAEYSFKKSWGTLWWLFSWTGTLAAGFPACAFLIVMVAEGDALAMVVSAILGFMGYFIFKRRFWQRPVPPDLSDLKQTVEDLRASISDLEPLITDLRTKKRTLLLRESDKVEKAMAEESAEMPAASVPDSVAEQPAPVSEKECPMCAEDVKLRAKICRFCGHQFEVVS